MLDPVLTLAQELIFGLSGSLVTAQQRALASLL